MSRDKNNVAMKFERFLTLFLTLKKGIEISAKQ
jgi:hypothetical protein